METLLTTFTSTFVEIIVILVGAFALILANKARIYLDDAKKKDELGIIQLVTDRVVAYAEAELKGEAGIKKRNFAVQKAVDALESRGISVSHDDIVAGIESGLVKLQKDKLGTQFTELQEYIPSEGVLFTYDEEDK